MTDAQEQAIRDDLRTKQVTIGGKLLGTDTYSCDVALLLDALDESRKTVAGLADRVAAQSELLSRRAEKPQPGRARLLGISGGKGSGKSTLARLLVGSGRLGRVEVRPLAAPLKAICVDLLGLPAEAVYGDDQAKQAKTGIRWEDLPHFEDGYGFMTVREVLQQVGTEVFRRMNPGCWINSLLADVARSTADLVIVDDVRFRDEAEAIQRAGGMVVRLTRGRNGGDGHASENDLAAWDGYDMILADNYITPEATAAVAVEQLRLMGWTKEVAP